MSKEEEIDFIGNPFDEEVLPVENPFEDPNRNNFPPLSHVFRIDNKSLKSISEEEHFRWSIEHIAELNPVDIEITARHRITQDSTYREVQKQVDQYFNNVALPSPWTPAVKTINHIQLNNDYPPQSPSQFSDNIALTQEENNPIGMIERSFQTDATIPFDINLEAFMKSFPYSDEENKDKNYELSIEDSFYSFSSTPSTNHKKIDFLPTGSGKDASMSFPDFLSPVNPSSRTLPIPFQPNVPNENNDLSNLRAISHTPTFSIFKH